MKESKPKIAQVEVLPPDTEPLQFGDLRSVMANLDGSSVTKVISDSEKAGTPIFPDSQLYESHHPLDLLIRYFLKRENITEDEFKVRHARVQNITSMPTNKSGSERSNILRSLRGANITWNAFERILNICGFDIINIELDVQDRNSGEVIKLSRKEIQAKALEEKHANTALLSYRTDIKPNEFFIPNILEGEKDVT